LTAVLLPQARQVAKSERTPRLRMLPSVIGRIGSSERGIGGHSIPGRDGAPEPAWNGGYAPHHRFVEASGTAPAGETAKRSSGALLCADNHVGAFSSIQRCASCFEAKPGIWNRLPLTQATRTYHPEADVRRRASKAGFGLGFGTDIDMACLLSL
jgi:hypothetical protein